MTGLFTIVNPRGYKQKSLSKIRDLNQFSGFQGAQVILFSNMKPNVNILFQEIESYIKHNYAAVNVGRVERNSAPLKPSERLINADAGSVYCAIVAIGD